MRGRDGGVEAGEVGRVARAGLGLGLGGGGSWVVEGGKERGRDWKRERKGGWGRRAERIRTKSMSDCVN